MRVSIRPQKAPDIVQYVQIDPDVYAAMQRLERQQSIPLEDQLRHAMKEYLNWYGVHITKRKKGVG